MLTDQEKKEGWSYELVNDLTGGLNSAKTAEALESKEFVTAHNVILQKARILSDTGIVTFGLPVRGTPMADYQFFKKSGSSELMLITTDTVYKWQATQWQYIQGSAGTTVAVQANAGATTVDVAAIAGFSNADFIGILLDDGSQHQTTVNGAPAGVTITFTDAIPVGRFAAVGAPVVRAVVLTGTTDEQVIMDTVASHDWFVFTNYADPPFRYDGTDCVPVPGLPSAGDCICRALAVYNSALFLFNTIEGGTAHPQRVRRSDIGDPTNWTTGTAGYDDLYGTSDPVMLGAKLGPYLVVYRERSIERGEFVGSPDGVNYKFDPMIQGEGLASTGGCIDIDELHIIYGNSNLYEYRAGFELEPVGDAIYYRMFGAQGNMNPEFRQRTFGFYVEELNEVWLFYVKVGSTYPNTLIRFNMENEAFTTREFPYPFTGFGFYQQEQTFRWSDLDGAWADQAWQWNSRSLEANSPTTHLMGPSPNQVYSYDYHSQTDNGTAVAFSLETKDFQMPTDNCRFDRLDVYGSGLNVMVEYSTDRGLSWNLLGTLNSGSVTRQALFLQFLFHKVRFRFSGTGAGFDLRWFGFLYKIESEF